jgi:hypothetical protein
LQWGLGGIATWVAISCLAASAGAAQGNDLGARIYREGILPSGAPLHAVGQNGIPLSGADAACINCHRRSGFGSSEGQFVVRPLALLFGRPVGDGPVLRAKALGSGRVPPVYDEAMIARALRDGVDAAGRSLDGLMPRYAIDDENVRLLTGYLRSFGTTPAPGVTATTIRFATVVTPDADRSSADAMLGVLRAFFADKNGGSRSEDRRRASGSEWMYLSYRTWGLDVWELAGPPASWGEQLEGYYRRQPVFALLSGMGAGNWQPVHAFCERVQIPCLLPNASAETSAADFYSVYYYREITLDAQVLAKHLLDRHPQPAPILQVYRSNERGRGAAQALRASLPGATIVDVALEGSLPASRALQHPVASPILVLWLGEDDLAEIAAHPEILSGAAEIYVSATLSLHASVSTERSLWQRVRVIYPFDLPRERDVRLARAKVWLRARRIALTDERVQADTFFAATLAGDVLSHLADNFSRDHFVERVEMMASRALNTSWYPRVSLGPGQRYASKGAYILGLPDDPGGDLRQLSGWIVP